MDTSTVQLREITLTYRGSGHASKHRIQCEKDAAKLFRDVIANDVRENFVALYLDHRKAPIGYRVVSIGTSNMALVHPRELFQPAITMGASAIIIAHNHPAGDPAPSPEDLTTTRRCVDAGTLLGIQVLDHLIIGADGFTSINATDPSLFCTCSTFTI